MKDNKICKIGPVELKESEFARLYSERKYIVTYGAIFQIHFSQAQGAYYGLKVHSKTTTGGVGFAPRGRFLTLTGAEVNKIVGAEILK
jgi:hypothetical protein